MLTFTSLVLVVVWADTGEMSEMQKHEAVTSKETSNEFSQQALIPIAVVIALCLYSGFIKSKSSGIKPFSTQNIPLLQCLLAQVS